MQHRGQGFSPEVIRESFGRSAKAFDRAAKRGEPGDPIAVPFGRYLLLDRIKRGGMAEVYRAKVVGHEGFEKIVAIKRILPHLAQNEDFVSMFIDEAKIVSYLNHQNICPVIELGRCEDGLYIVMEYIWGRDLRQILNAMARTGRLMPINVATYIAARICEGLDYAHRRTGPGGRPLDLVHRDISPQNVLVSFDGEVKIIDFGIASASQRSTETRAGTFKGKFAYMSPEQARGQALDRRSDVFASGILLHEMLTGSRLFAGKSDLETLDRVRNCQVPPPSRPFEQLPGDLVQITMRALEAKPEDRFGWAGEMQEALDRFLVQGGELASASRLGTWICINFSEEAGQALLDQERAARARPADESRAEDLSSGASRSGYGMPAFGSSDRSASESVSESLADPPSPSVEAYADEQREQMEENLAFEVDEEAFGLEAPEAEEQVGLPDPAAPPLRAAHPAPARTPPWAGSPQAVPARAGPRAPAPAAGGPARGPGTPPPSGSYDRRESTVDIPVDAPGPEVRDQGNRKRRRRLDPVEVEYSPWTRFVPGEDPMAADPVASRPPSETGVRVSATLEPESPDETVIVDEPPPGCVDDDEHGTDPDAEL